MDSKVIGLIQGISTEIVNNAVTEVNQDITIINQTIDNINVGNPVDLLNYYTQSQMNNLLNNKANTSHIHGVSDVTDLENELSNRYTKLETLSKTEIETLVNSIARGMNWKESITNESLLPMVGNTISDTRVIQDVSQIVIWNGVSWIGLGSSSNIPLATELLDGQMSKEDKIKLDSIVLANLVTYVGGNIIVDGDILASGNGTQNIGSPTNRFGAIYVNEAMLSTNTLYIGDTPILGTTDDTIMIKADPDQSITMKTSGVGTTKVISASGVELSTSGMNADVTVQATGSGSNANIGATNQVNLNAPHINIVGDADIAGNTALDNLTVRGNLVINGGSTTIESTTVQVEDNIIELNKNEVGYGVTAGKSGLKINRGDADDYLIVFDETDDNLKIGTDSSLKSVSTKEYVDNKTVNKLETTNIKAGSNISVNVSGNDVTINSTGGTEGVSDLSSFTTDDLSESSTKKYTSPTEKDTWNNKLDKTNIKAGNNVNVTTSGNDVTINVTGADATSINNIPVDNSSLSNGRVLTYNQSLNRYENAQINVAGIIGSSQLTNVGDMIDIASGAEVTFVHPTTTDENIMINVQEQIQGSSVTDTHVDFSDSSKYTLQDTNKLLFNSNKVQIKNATYCVNNYKFEETSGTSCVDSKGLYNGTYVGTTSVMGNIGNARSFNGTSDYISFSNQVIPLGKKSIKFKVKSTNTSTMRILSNNNAESTYYGITISMINGKIYIALSKGTASVYNLALISNTVINDGYWHTVLFTWDGTTNTNSAKLYIDNILEVYATPLSVELINASNNLYIGRQSNSSTNYFNGQLDELEIYNDVVDVTNLNTNPTYLQTTGNSDYSLTTINSITSLTIPVTTPTNTSIKCLFSVNNGVDWLYKDGTGINKYTGDLTQIWTSSNTNTELQTYFTNLSMTQLTSDLSALEITPVSLYFAFQLNTNDVTITPSVNAITMIYATSPHTELASFGSYEESGVVKFGVKRVSNSVLSVKNLTNKSRKINVNVLLGS